MPRQRAPPSPISIPARPPPDPPSTSPLKSSSSIPLSTYLALPTPSPTRPFFNVGPRPHSSMALTNPNLVSSSSSSSPATTKARGKGRHGPIAKDEPSTLASASSSSTNLFLRLKRSATNLRPSSRTGHPARYCPPPLTPPISPIDLESRIGSNATTSDKDPVVESDRSRPFANLVAREDDETDAQSRTERGNARGTGTLKAWLELPKARDAVGNRITGASSSPATEDTPSKSTSFPTPSTSTPASTTQWPLTPESPCIPLLSPRVCDEDSSSLFDLSFVEEDGKGRSNPNSWTPKRGGGKKDNLVFPQRRRASTPNVSPRATSRRVRRDDEDVKERSVDSDDGSDVDASFLFSTAGMGRYDLERPRRHSTMLVFPSPPSPPRASESGRSTPFRPRSSLFPSPPSSFRTPSSTPAKPFDSHTVAEPPQTPPPSARLALVGPPRTPSPSPPPIGALPPVPICAGNALGLVRGGGAAEPSTPPSTPPPRSLRTTARFGSPRKPARASAGPTSLPRTTRRFSEYPALSTVSPSRRIHFPMSTKASTKTRPRTVRSPHTSPSVSGAARGSPREKVPRASSISSYGSRDSDDDAYGTDFDLDDADGPTAFSRRRESNDTAPSSVPSSPSRRGSVSKAHAQNVVDHVVSMSRSCSNATSLSSASYASFPSSRGDSPIPQVPALVVTNQHNQSQLASPPPSPPRPPRPPRSPLRPLSRSATPLPTLVFEPSERSAEASSRPDVADEDQVEETIVIDSTRSNGSLERDRRASQSDRGATSSHCASSLSSGVSPSSRVSIVPIVDSDRSAADPETISIPARALYDFAGLSPARFDEIDSIQGSATGRARRRDGGGVGSNGEEMTVWKKRSSAYLLSSASSAANKSNWISLGGLPRSVRDEYLLEIPRRLSRSTSTSEDGVEDDGTDFGDEGDEDEVDSDVEGEVGIGGAGFMSVHLGQGKRRPRRRNRRGSKARSTLLAEPDLDDPLVRFFGDASQDSLNDDFVLRMMDKMDVASLA
ncbi:hypothetical protein JCM10212_002630 [Sporobolomyces blumeae]